MTPRPPPGWETRVAFVRTYPGIGMFVIGPAPNGDAPSAGDPAWHVVLVEHDDASPRLVVSGLPLADAAYMAEHHASRLLAVEGA